MGYAERMYARRASPAPQPDAVGDWVEEPLTDAGVAACEEAGAQIARGEWVDGHVVMAELRAMAARHRVRAARGRIGADDGPDQIG